MTITDSRSRTGPVLAFLSLAVIVAASGYSFGLGGILWSLGLILGLSSIAVGLAEIGRQPKGPDPRGPRAL